MAVFPGEHHWENNNGVWDKMGQFFNKYLIIYLFSSIQSPLLHPKWRLLAQYGVKKVHRLWFHTLNWWLGFRVPIWPFGLVSRSMVLYHKDYHPEGDCRHQAIHRQRKLGAVWLQWHREGPQIFEREEGCSIWMKRLINLDERWVFQENLIAVGKFVEILKFCLTNFMFSFLLEQFSLCRRFMVDFQILGIPQGK